MGRMRRNPEIFNSLFALISITISISVSVQAGDEASLLPWLEKIAGKIPLERFDSDVQLMQKVEGTGTTYTLIGDTKVLIERAAQDKGKDLLVFGDEDFGPKPPNGFQKLWIVLKKKGGEGDAYYASIAVFRFPSG